MRNILIAFFILFEIILVSSQSPKVEGEHEIKGTYTTVSVPTDLSALGDLRCWSYKNYKFSVKIADPNSPAQDFGDTYTYTGNAKTPFTGQEGEGFFIGVESSDFDYNVPSLECGKFGKQVSLGCNRDTGTLPMEAKQWCLLITNPFTNIQKVDVAVSFTGSVLFTTPAIVVGGGGGPSTSSSIKTTDFSYVKSNASKRKRSFKRNGLFKV